MNALLVKQLRAVLYHLPNWAVSLFGIACGLMIMLNLLTWDALCVFFDRPFMEWFGDIWDVLIGPAVATFGVLYNPRAKPPVLLEEEVP